MTGVQFVCASVITFSDGGPESVMLLSSGTEEECRRTADLVPAISYNGDRPDPKGRLVIIPREWWDEWLSEQKEPG